jgi:chaperone modulatory protein CbpM
MSMETGEFLLHARLTPEALDAWVEAGWLVPGRDDGKRRFSEIDVARARLIRDLKQDLGVNDEGIPVILDLVDQMHGLRQTLREVLTVLGAQPERTRQTILADMRVARAGRAGGGADRAQRRGLREDQAGFGAEWR